MRRTSVMTVVRTVGRQSNEKIQELKNELDTRSTAIWRLALAKYAMRRAAGRKSNGSLVMWGTMWGKKRAGEEA